MTTAFSDFIFYAVGSGSVGLGDAHGKTSAALGGSEADDASMGRAAVGSALTHTDLSNPLPAGIAGTKGRVWAFNSGSDNTSTNWHAVAGAGYLHNDAGGANYPTSNATDGNTSYSCRAFLRLSSPEDPSTTSGGTNVGLFHKGHHSDGSTKYGGETQSHENNHTIVPEMNARSGLINAYTLSLGDGKITGVDDKTPPRDRGGSSYGAGTAAAPRLMIVPALRGGHQSIYSSAANPGIDDKYAGMSHRCDGTYALDTWYHVRFDMVREGNNDLLIAYTAPISGAGSAVVAGLGSETWTEVGRLSVPGGAPMHYRPWTDAAEKYSGYWYQSQHTWRTTVYTPDPMIDRFQFLTKTVS